MLRLGPVGWLAATVLFVACAIWSPAFLVRLGLDKLDKLSSIGSFVLGATSLILSVRAYRREMEERDAERIAGSRRRVRHSIRIRRTYLRYISARNYDIDGRGLGIQGPFSLDVQSVFVDVSLVPRSPHAAGGDLLGGGDLSEQLPSARGSVWRFLRRWPPNTLAIIGPPGSGKSTLLQHLALQLAARRGVGMEKARRKVPLLLILRDSGQRISADPNVSLSEIVHDSLPLSVRPPVGWIERQLRRGRCLVMFDGLDEVSSYDHRRLLIDWVASQVAQYRRNGFLVTSRPHGYLSNPLPSADVVQVRPFTDQQIETFLKRWYMATEIRRTGRRDDVILADAAARAQDLLHRLEKAPLLYDLATNPLLLTMIAHVHNYRGMLPGGRAELYKEIFQVFLGRRQEAKGLENNLTSDQRELVLRHLALEMMRHRLRDVPSDQACRIIRGQLARVSPREDPAEFLKETEQLSGLLLQRESGAFSFAHLTFQEFLAAAAIRARGLSQELTDYIDDVWWREVVLLYCAQADAGAIVYECLKAPTSKSLLLALDGATVARELDPALRARLEATVSRESHSSDSKTAQLIGEVLLGRKIRNIYRRSGVGIVVSEPITRAEYRLFVESERLLGRDRRPPYWTDHLAKSQPDTPVNGVVAEDAKAFGVWLSFSEGWEYQPLATGMRNRDGFLDRSDIAVIRNWTRLLDWDAVEQQAPRDINRAADFLRELAGTDGLQGYRKQEMRMNWRALKSAFDGHEHQDRNLGVVGLRGSEWSATRLLQGLTQAYADENLVTLKMWQLEEDQFFEDDEVEEKPIPAVFAGYGENSDSGELLRPSSPDHIHVEISEIAAHVQAFLKSFEVKLYQRRWGRMIGRGHVGLLDLTELLADRWDQWSRSDTRDREILQECKAAAFGLNMLLPPSGRSELVVKRIVRLLEEFILIDWEARGLIRGEGELWLKRA